MNITDAIKIKPTQWATGVVLCMGTLAPGVLVIYTFKPDLFIALETAKLALLATALTLPLVLLNVFAVLPRALMNGPKDINSAEPIDSDDLYLSACMATASCLYPAIAAAYFLNLPFSQFCIIVLILDIALTAWQWGSFWPAARR